MMSAKERQVVLEEIKMDLDNPESLLHEIFTRGFWPEHPLGRPILGTPDTVRQFSREALQTRFREWFAPIICWLPPPEMFRTIRYLNLCSVNSDTLLPRMVGTARSAENWRSHPRRAQKKILSRFTLHRRAFTSHRA